MNLYFVNFNEKISLIFPPISFKILAGLEKFSFTYFLYTTTSEVQTIFVGHSPTGALGL